VLAGAGHLAGGGKMKAWVTGQTTPRQTGRGIRPVVSVPGEDGIAELLAYAAWLARLHPTCQCGQPLLGSGRTCGSAECVARLRQQENG